MYFVDFSSNLIKILVISASETLDSEVFIRRGLNTRGLSTNVLG